MKYSSDEIVQLLIKSLKGDLNPIEEEKLQMWIKSSPRHRRLYDKWRTKAFLASQIRLSESIDLKGDYRSFMERCDMKLQPKGDCKKSSWRLGEHLLLRGILRYAAVLLIPLCVCGYFAFHFLSKEEHRDLVADRIAIAGDRHAVLTLSSGKRVLLADSLVGAIQEEIPVRMSMDSSGLIYGAEKEITTPDAIYHKINVPRGGEYFLSLSDGTKIWLNSETEICFPIAFKQEERLVYLSGEAFFDVAKDKNKPFIVVANGTRVSVHGTCFDLRAYGDEDVVSTVLVEGIVSLATSSLSYVVRLEPGEMGIVDNNAGTITKEKVDTYLYTSWKDGRFVFRDTRIEDIMKILSRWYDLSVFYANNEVRDYRFTGDLDRGGSYQSILHLIEENERVAFDINKQTVVVKKK